MPIVRKDFPIRLALSTLLLSSAVVANAAAQGASQAPTSSTPGGEPVALMEEPAILTQGIDLIGGRFGEEGNPKTGFFPDFAGPITGSGWIAVGPGYRHRLFNGRALVDGSATISWRGYKKASARFELTDLADHRLLVGTQVRWLDLTQIGYFGIGAERLESERSQYRLKSTDVLGYANLRATGWLTIGGRLAWLKQPTLASPAGSFKRDFPNALERFASDPGVSNPASFLHGDVSVTADSRNFPGHPTAGGLYRVSAAVYSDRDYDAFSFRRYEVEGLQVVPVSGKTWLLAVHGRGVFSDASDGNDVPFYLLPSLGGQNTLRGYSDYRFHDRHLLVVSGESRWALWQHLDAAVFVDTGNVAARASDLNLRKISYGAGVRVHNSRSTFLRVDVAHSREGYRIVFRTSDPFSLSRRTERTTIAPFVP